MEVLLDTILVNGKSLARQPHSGLGGLKKGLLIVVAAWL
jgi:hypothetical protein